MPANHNELLKPREVDIPPGYVFVDVILTAPKAFIARKWAKEAQVNIESDKLQKDLKEQESIVEVVKTTITTEGRRLGVDSRNETGRFKKGQRCQIISVHHHVFEKEVGKFVIIFKVSSNSSQVWAYEDAVVKFRINRNGRKVVEYDPKTVLSLYNFDQLHPDIETGDIQDERAEYKI